MRKLISFIVFCTTLILLSVVDYQPKIIEEAPLPNFARFYDIKLRKRLFIEFMRLLIKGENDFVMQQRIQFLKLYKKRTGRKALTAYDMRVFERFAELYFVNLSEYDQDESWEILKRRIDVIPTELALAQSANESAWGRSRFAIEGNAMFGQWSFSKTKVGMIPSARDLDSTHTVARFPSVRAAVKSYIKNLNTHRAYLAFRVLRSKARAGGSELDGHSLAPGLINYSERREVYVREIQSIMKTNKSFMDLDLQ